MGKNGRTGLNLAMLIGGSALLVNGLANIIGDTKKRVTDESTARIACSDPWQQLREQNQELYFKCLKEIGGK